MTGPMRTVGHTVMALLAAYGVDTVFGIPGTHNLELYRPLRELGIRAVTTRHESGAGYAADGYARRSGRPGVVLTTSGPGLLNALSAAGTSYAESRPVLMLSPGPARGAEDVRRGGLHATKDQSAAAAAVVRWSRRVANEAEAVEAVHAAFESFSRQRPQPVHVELPLDLLESPSGSPAFPQVPRASPPRPRADPEALRQAVDLLEGARAPAILAGGGAVSAVRELAALAEALGAPVATSINGKAALPESHALSLGSELRLAATTQALAESDVLLVVGSKRSEAELWERELRGPAVIRIELDAEELAADADVRVALLGDAGETLAELGRRVTPSAAREARAAGIRARQRDEVERAAPDLVALAERVAAGLPAGAVVTGDSSRIVYHALTSVLRQDEPRSFLYMATYATLGYALPAALGARLASPHRPVVAVVGDGALMQSVAELATAVELGLDLTVVCVDDGGYGEIRQNQLDRGILPIGVDLHQPDWVALAAAFGASSESVTLHGVTRAVQEATGSHGVRFLHVPMPSTRA